MKSADAKQSPTDISTTAAKPLAHPKDRHLDVCMQPEVEYAKSNGFVHFELHHSALPELDLGAVSLQSTLLGKAIGAPLMIAPMTGGTPRARVLNRRLARAAARWNIPMGVGSQRVAIEDPTLADTFRIRDLAPEIPLFANLGAGQLVAGWGVAEALQAIEMIEADGLFIHLNPLQEAIQGGDVNFSGLCDRIAALCEALNQHGTPLFVREVGFGLDASSVTRLLACGIAGLDCAGAGGTSWAKAEALCAKSERRAKLGAKFGEWGIPTAEVIQQIRGHDTTIPLIASGGLRSGQEVAKALALGADIAAMARPMLLQADQGDDALDSFIADTLMELRISMFACGAGSVAELRSGNRISRVATSSPDTPSADG
jgi:isopentenyl-diphosphate delta-isomerase